MPPKPESSRSTTPSTVSSQISQVERLLKWKESPTPSIILFHDTPIQSSRPILLDFCHSLQTSLSRESIGTTTVASFDIVFIAMEMSVNWWVKLGSGFGVEWRNVHFVDATGVKSTNVFGSGNSKDLVVAREDKLLDNVFKSYSIVTDLKDLVNICPGTNANSVNNNNERKYFYFIDSLTPLIRSLSTSKFYHLLTQFTRSASQHLISIHHANTSTTFTTQMLSNFGINGTANLTIKNYAEYVNKKLMSDMAKTLVLGKSLLHVERNDLKQCVVELELVKSNGKVVKEVVVYQFAMERGGNVIVRGGNMKNKGPQITLFEKHEEAREKENGNGNKKEEMVDDFAKMEIKPAAVAPVSTVNATKEETSEVVINNTSSSSKRITAKPKAPVKEEKQEDPTEGLTFNLKLTDAQREARSQVVLPYMEVQGNNGGMIIYQPDFDDDFDDEDPDADLDI